MNRQGVERGVRRAGVLAGVLALGALLGLANTGAGYDGPDRTATARIIELTNAAREENAQPPLSVNRRLTLAAEAYARDMERRDWFEHIGPDGASIEARAEASGYRDWAFLGENLATGPGAGDPADLVERWLRSPAHRRNILSPDLEEIGVGCSIRTGAPARFWCAQEFGARAK